MVEKVIDDNRWPPSWEVNFKVSHLLPPCKPKNANMADAGKDTMDGLGNGGC